MINPITSVVLAMFLAGATVPAWADQRDFHRTFNSASGGQLTVRADTGQVRVIGNDSEQVIVAIVAHGSRRTLDRMQLDAQQNSAGVIVTVKRSETRWLGWLQSMGDDEVRIEISVPRRYNIDLDTSGGDIGVSHLVGDAHGKTSGGNVRIEDVQGPVTMKTSGGNLHIAGVRGNVEVSTSGGSIYAHAVAGKLDGYTSGGDVKADELTGVVRLRTTGGNMEATHVTGPIEAHTSGGDVVLYQIDGAIRADTSGGDVRVELVGVNRGIDLTTSGGDIVVQLPATVKATLDASSGNGSVRSDLPITTTVSSESKLSGTINGGGEWIRARTSGGDVHLQSHGKSVVDNQIERS